MLFRSSDNKLFFTFQSLIFSIISFTAIFGREIINGELLVLFKTNYLFHIFNTKSVFTELFGQRLLALYESFTYPFERGSNFGLTMYLLAIAFAAYIIFYSKNFNNKVRVNSLNLGPIMKPSDKKINNIYKTNYRSKDGISSILKFIDYILKDKKINGKIFNIDNAERLMINSY